MTVLEADILSVPPAAANGPDRCYHCKTALFSLLRAAAARDGYPLLLDGTNASDDAGDRPGMRALRELAVRSPLRECGISKAEVRARSREAGLFTWNKSAYACLATRIPTGTPITAEALSWVEGAPPSGGRPQPVRMNFRLRWSPISIRSCWILRPGREADINGQQT